MSYPHREDENNSLRFSEFIHGLLDTIYDLHGFTLKTTCNEFDWHLENLCKKLIEILKSTNRPDKLPAEINIEFHEGANIMGFVQRLFCEEKTLEKEAIRRDNLLKEVVFKRDQWYLVMAMEYNNNARNSVKALRLKFLHS
uniref:Uncharacterized protein n=1 Tax=Acrobeloides nanus TaxID=290746 RepID=A0A914EAC7_9BILA